MADKYSAADKFLKVIVHFTIYVIWPHYSTKKPCPDVMNFKIFGRFFLGYHCCFLSVSELFLGNEKTIF